jgi:hypothetical protein
MIELRMPATFVAGLAARLGLRVCAPRFATIAAMPALGSLRCLPK